VLCLKLEKITKFFPGVKALDGVDFSLHTGEVHALCGENGAGKSTLMNIVTGNYQPDGGSIWLYGQQVVIADQKDAQRKGISIVYQERSLVDSLSIAENIFAGRQPVNHFGLIDRAKLDAMASHLLQRLGLHNLAPRDPVSLLSPAMQQMVEIAKALSHQPRILVLDEPTASITESETQVLFGLIRELKAQGTGVIYISHRMAEIFEIADRVTVLKDGTYQGTRLVADCQIDDVIRLMVGRDLQAYPYSLQSKADTVLEVKQLTGTGFANVSFSLQKGEMLGLAGLVGAGRSEMARALMGAEPLLGGEIWLKGQRVTFSHPAQAIASGIGYLPENRKEQGLFLEMDVTDNVIAAAMPLVARGGLIQENMAEQMAASFVRQLRIKTPGVSQKVVNLSGGNQQKVVLARWLMRNPEILIVDEPTHGVDVGAKAEIYLILQSLLQKGVSIILISSELPELLALSDRVLVMCNGTLTAVLNRKEASEHLVMQYASGIKNMFAHTPFQG
jgi:ABC-type sugar transport system ATPase subunit